METTHSAEAAEKKGLPTGWTASRNKGGRWTYVAPDGAVADYDEANVPFRPDSRLRLCGSGAADGDFVFLLGYPGSTNRYAPSRRLRYSDEVTTPALIRDFKRKLELIGKYEVDDDVARLKLAGAKKSLANELKRSDGKLVVARKIGLVEERGTSCHRLDVKLDGKAASRMSVPALASALKLDGDAAAKIVRGLRDECDKCDRLHEIAREKRRRANRGYQ